MDGFFDREEFAISYGTRAFQGNDIYESLKRKYRATYILIILKTTMCFLNIKY